MSECENPPVEDVASRRQKVALAISVLFYVALYLGGFVMGLIALGQRESTA